MNNVLHRHLNHRGCFTYIFAHTTAYGIINGAAAVTRATHKTPLFVNLNFTIIMNLVLTLFLQITNKFHKKVIVKDSMKTRSGTTVLANVHLGNE